MTSDIFLWVACSETSLFFHFHHTAPVTLSFQSKWACEHQLGCLVSQPSSHPKLSTAKRPLHSYSQFQALRHGVTTCSAYKSRDPKPMSTVVHLGHDKCSFWPWHVISCSVLRNVSNCSIFVFFLAALQRSALGWRLAGIANSISCNETSSNCLLLALCLLFGEALLSCVDTRDFSWNTGLPFAVCPLFLRLKRKSNAAI